MNSAAKHVGDLHKVQEAMAMVILRMQHPIMLTTRNPKPSTLNPKPNPRGPFKDPPPAEPNPVADPESHRGRSGEEHAKQGDARGEEFLGFRAFCASGGSGFNVGAFIYI